MNIRRLLKFIFLACFLPSTLTAADLNVYSLYDDSFLVPKILIPFHVSGTEVSDTVSAKVGSHSSGDCRIMQDPFQPSNFHLKCSEEATVTLVFSIIRGNSLYNLNYGPFTLKNKTGVVIKDPFVTSDPVRALGKSLYFANCLECHKAEALDKLKGKSISQIQNSFDTTDDMLEYNFALPTDQMQALERFFKDITPAEKRGE